MIARLFVASVLFALAACGGGGGPTPAPMGPPPAPPPAPGSPVLTADLAAPIAPTGLCPSQPNPFHCDLPPGAAWGLIQASDAAKFSPGAIGLGFATGSGSGMALISATSLDRSSALSVREVVRVDSLDCAGSVSYVGPVAYGGGVDDGDPTGRYRAEYVSCFPGDQSVRVWLYSPTYAGVMPGSPVVPLGTHVLRIDWYPGSRVDYFLDDESRPLFTEDASFGHDPLDAPHDLRPSMWFGSVSGAVLSFGARGAPGSAP